MTAHKADDNFFDAKRSWSERKDLILDFYLKPYLAKISTLGHPLLLVDGFAGPGQFGDGTVGSPVILARQLSALLERRPHLHATLICIEANLQRHETLREQMDAFPFAEAWHGEFIDFVPQLQDLSAGASTFLYLDPFTVHSLEWAALEVLFRPVTKGQSVEVLLNFNTPIFVREGRAALKLSESPHDPESGEFLEGGESPPESRSIERLNRSVGGDWWQPLLRNESVFKNNVRAVADGVERQLRRWFDEVCVHAVKDLPHHSIPKYHLMFGSRHPAALRLMNDAMRKSLDRLAQLAESDQPSLFEIRPKSLVPDPEDLKPLILRMVDRPTPRGAVIDSIMRSARQSYSEKEIRRAITALLESGELVSASGRARINDSELISPRRQVE